jgi:hypothetical protein
MDQQQRCDCGRLAEVTQQTLSFSAGETVASVVHYCGRCNPHGEYQRRGDLVRQVGRALGVDVRVDR